MILVIIAIVFLGFYALYNTSERALLNTTKVDKCLQKHPKTSSLSGFMLIGCSFGLAMNYYGIGAGTLLTFIVLMTIGSLVVVVSPLISKNK